MADDEHTADLVNVQPPADSPAELPERLRVHSLARVLGTTSRRVLDALRELDGRSRSAHSSIDQADAVRVRELLAGAAAAEVVVEAAPEPDTQTGTRVEAAGVTGADAAVDTGAEPESRLILETPEQPAPHGAAVAEPPAYMPLFVAPQPIAVVPQPEPEADTDAGPESESESESEPDGAAEAEGTERQASRRRRRGRRGRGRGRGEQGEDDDAESASEDDGSSGDDEAGADDESGEDTGDESEAGATRRRRRRRRRKSGAGDGADGSAGDDPPNTVVHERAPRDKAERSDEIQGISGSTRLEAKRQRRRDGRDAGRRNRLSCRRRSSSRVARR